MLSKSEREAQELALIRNMLRKAALRKREWWWDEIKELFNRHMSNGPFISFNPRLFEQVLKQDGWECQIFGAQRYCYPDIKWAIDLTLPHYLINSRGSDLDWVFKRWGLECDEEATFLDLRGKLRDWYIDGDITSCDVNTNADKTDPLGQISEMLEHCFCGSEVAINDWLRTDNYHLCGLEVPKLSEVCSIIQADAEDDLILPVPMETEIIRKPLAMLLKSYSLGTLKEVYDLVKKMHYSSKACNQC